jgi:serine/threonine-protein kinase
MAETSAPSRWRRLKDLFAEAVEGSEAGREELLARVRAEDPDLAAELTGLLEAHRADGGFVERIVADAARDALESRGPEAFAGRRVGPWELLRPVGAGGMGAVFLARRADAEYEATVAVKMLRPGLFSEDSLRRFRAERQALANLSHPGIARLLDGGTTADGSPYIVMEYVAGVPIDAYAQARGLSVERRLRLFRAVCDAVQFAHRNLVVHRDIKPANVLVTEEGEPRLLDFGIAKVLDENAAEGLTRAGDRALTPDFASPEQIRGETVTTSTDVYSLGVVLYRLLTNRHPYAFPSGRTSEIERIVCERQPDRPSVHASGLEGDLDNIVLKALAKEPERRYATVEQLSEDLRRHLDGEPVLARKSTFLYRASRFLRRHRTASLAAAVAAAALLAALGLSLSAARRARLEAQKAEQVNAFLQTLLGAASPWRDGTQVTVKEVLDRASKRIETDLRGQPEVEAAVRRTIGETYAGLGLYDPAEAQLQASLALSRRLGGTASDDAVAETLLALASLSTSRGAPTQAEAPAREALAMLARLHGEGDASVAGAWRELGSVLQARGDLAQAESAQRRAIAIFRKAAPSSAGLAEALNDLAVTLGTRGDLPAAEALHREALAVARRAHPGPHPDVAEALSTLASSVWDTRRDAAEAQSLYEQALAMRRGLFGENHPDTSWVLYNYAYMLMEKGDFPRSEELARQALRGRGTTLPDEHPMVASTLVLLGRCRLGQNDPVGAEPPLREGLALRRRSLPAEHWLIASSESVLGESLAGQGRLREAEPLLTAGYEKLKARFGDESPKVREAALRLERLREGAGSGATRPR